MATPTQPPVKYQQTQDNSNDLWSELTAEGDIPLKADNELWKKITQEDPAPAETDKQPKSPDLWEELNIEKPRSAEDIAKGHALFEELFGEKETENKPVDPARQAFVDELFGESKKEPGPLSPQTQEIVDIINRALDSTAPEKAEPIQVQEPILPMQHGSEAIMTRSLAIDRHPAELDIPPHHAQMGAKLPNIDVTPSIVLSDLDLPPMMRSSASLDITQLPPQITNAVVTPVSKMAARTPEIAGEIPTPIERPVARAGSSEPAINDTPKVVAPTPKNLETLLSEHGKKVTMPRYTQAVSCGDPTSGLNQCFSGQDLRVINATNLYKKLSIHMHGGGSAFMDFTEITQQNGTQTIYTPGGSLTVEMSAEELNMADIKVDQSFEHLGKQYANRRFNSIKVGERKVYSDDPIHVALKDENGDITKVISLRELATLQQEQQAIAAAYEASKSPSHLQSSSDNSHLPQLLPSQKMQVTNISLK